MPVTISLRQRDLITEHTFADPDLTKLLRLAETKGRKLLVKFTLDELDELRGYVAAEANHTKDEKLKREMDTLFGHLTDTMESYDDGMWPEGSYGIVLGQSLGAR